MPHTTRIAIAIDSISIAHCPTIKSGNGPTQNACPSASKGMVHGTTLLQYQYYSYSSQLWKGHMGATSQRVIITAEVICDPLVVNGESDTE